MKATLMLAGAVLSLELAALAEVVSCAPREARREAEFEVMGEKLPALDYLASIENCLVRLSGQPPERPVSPWLESQRAAYRSALAKQPADVLVAPFQNQGYGLERTERAVMGADLAYHLERGVRVADPFLTARALGEGARSYERSDIVALAHAVGAKTAIVGYVGHDHARRMTVTIEVLKLDPSGNTAAVIEVVQKNWRGVPFTHADPPFVVFHRMLPSVIDSLALPRAGEATRDPVVVPESVEFTLKDLAAGQPPIGASLGLTLLGAMSASTDERSRERLFARALVASWHFDAVGDAATFLQAYALLNLEHRPAALARIAGSTRPESTALRAVLNGDLPGASAALPKIANPLVRLLLAVHVDDLRYAYEREGDTPESRPEPVFGDAVEWLVLNALRANDLNRWYVDEPAVLKALLDDVYPIAGLDVQSLLSGGQLVGAQSDDVAVDLATLRHVARFVAGETVPVCCSVAGARATAWDVVSLLEGRTQSRIGKYLDLTTRTRGSPEVAGAALERYDDTLEGHPVIALARADYALAMAERSQDEALDNWRRQAQRDAFIASYLSGGQNLSAYRGVENLGIRGSSGSRLVDAYGLDYPRRPYWPQWWLRSEAGFGPEFDTLVEAQLFEASEYARTEAGAVVLSHAGLSEQHKIRARADLAVRFIGHPNRAAFIAMLDPPRQPSDDPVADARARLAADPEDWNARYGLGLLLIQREGKWEEAAEVFLGYPPFHEESPQNRVRLSNHAFETGSIFYFSGQHELAKPLYEIAAKLRTGSNGSMASEIRLNILAGRYQSAAEGSFVRAQRYPDAYPFRDFLSFLHAFGYGQQAWEGFSQVSAAFDNPQVWVSALVGHRRDALTEPQIRAWLKRPGIRDAKFRSNAFAPRYAVLVNASDHETPEDLGDLVAEIEGEPGARMEGGVLQRPHGDDPTDLAFVPRSTLINSHPGAADGTRIKSEYAFFGHGYASIRHGRFPAALEEFRAMAAYYPLELFEYSFALPYFAWAAAKTGDVTGLEKALDEYVGIEQSFDFNLARAFFHGVRKDTESARAFLEAALRSHPYTDHRPVLIEYQYAEACEWLYQETGDTSFIDVLLDWVQSQQATQPTLAWAYAMEYTYARTPERRLRALAMTMHLDPTSPRIRSASERERREADAWNATHNPFLQELEPAAADEAAARIEQDAPTRG